MSKVEGILKESLEESKMAMKESKRSLQDEIQKFSRGESSKANVSVVLEAFLDSIGRARTANLFVKKK